MLYTLFRAFSCDTVAGLIAERDALASSIAGLEVSGERIGELKKEISEEAKKLAEAASALSGARHSAAGSLSEAIRDTVRSMELPDAEFRIVLSPSSMTSDGADTVSYEFSSTGRNPVDVAKCASGGEMFKCMGDFYPVVRMRDLYQMDEGFTQIQDGILMWLEVSGPDTLRGIMDGVTDDRNKEKEIFIRIQELAELGLVQTVRAHPGQSGAKVLRQLTPEGHRVAKRLLAFFEEMGEGCE